MTFEELKNKSELFVPVVKFESIFPHPVRRKLEQIFLTLFIIGAGYSIFLDPTNPQVGGASFLILSFWMILVAIDAHFYSFYYRNLRSDTEITYELASVLIKTQDNKDIAKSFFNTSLGLSVLTRLGLSKENLDDFFNVRHTPVSAYGLQVNESTNTLFEYVSLVFNQDKELQEFLIFQNISEEDLVGATLWVERTLRRIKQRQRWWSKEYLSRTRQLGIDWSYGKTYLLDRVSRTLDTERSRISVSNYYDEYVSSLANILIRAREANALLVGKPGVGKLDIVAKLQRDIESGAFEDLKNYQARVLDADLAFSEVKDSADLEERMISIFNQAERSGNSIVVIENLASFIRRVDSFGSDFISIIDPYLMSPNLHFIFTSTEREFHEDIETKGQFMKRVEHLFVREGGLESVVRLLEDEVMEIESKELVIFTYPAISELARRAREYFSGVTVSDKAMDLLYEMVPIIKRKERNFIFREDVYELLEAKTGIPSRTAGEEEKEKLANLENILRKRVVGQDEAIEAVSNALRRARSGLGDTKRPLGSFLFLGPTGVGKTETTKALAETFFGGNDRVIRFDMSEFSGPEAIDRLIGSSGGETQGLLSSKLKENPYGVLHLDEFEKSTEEVHDLFLQILDEGRFTDTNGVEISARNMIIVATSNAGSDVIWDYVNGGGKLSLHKEKIINTIIKRGIYKPELLNRFDDLILFHPLKKEHLQKIVELFLDKLKDRLKDQGIKISVEPGAVDFLVEKGTDPKFGARPLRRAIQSHIENFVAGEVIGGSLGRGDTVSISREDIEKKESNHGAGDSSKGEHVFAFEDSEDN